MPVTPPFNPTRYDSVTNILNAVRFRLNARMSSLYPTSGKVLEETQASTQQAFNNAYRKLQDALCDAGVERFYADIVIPNIPVTTNLDPASQCSISWLQFFDGTNYLNSPVLPADMVLPLWMSERWSGTNAQFPPADQPNMRCQTDGIEMTRKYPANGQWEWRGEQIVFPGSTVPMDFRLRYKLYLPDITDSGSTRWFMQTVPIMRCQDALAWWVAFEYAAARSMDGNAAMMAVAGYCMSEAKKATDLLANRDIMKNQRDDVRRQPYGRGSSGSFGGSR